MTEERKEWLGFVAKRLINDVPNNKVKDLNTTKFAALCRLFYEKIINNQQFKRFVNELCYGSN